MFKDHLTRKNIIIGLAAVLALAAAGFAIYKYASDDTVDQKQVNLSAEERQRIESERSELEREIGELPAEADPNRKFDLYFKLGEAERVLGNLEKSEKSFLTASEINAKESLVWEALSDVQSERNKFKEALKSIDTALFLASGEARYWLKKISISENGLAATYEEIESLYNEAFFATNIHQDIAIAYARRREARGEIGSALSYYRIALQRDPENEAIKKEIRRLEEAIKNINN